MTHTAKHLESSFRTFLVAVFLGAMSAAAGANVGAVKVASGVVTAQTPGGPARLLSPGAQLQEGDVLSTASRSFAVLEMGDGSRMTVRPRTVLALEEYKFKDRESAVLRLFRGGLRAITGFISKRNNDAFKIRTPVATIGIRGTAFEARLCDEECAAESARSGQRSPTAQTAAPIAARVVFLRGNVEADRGAGRNRKLSLGASLYEGDVIGTAPRSLAVLSFKDGTRVTVVPNSSFKIEQMTFERAAPEKDSMFLRLLRGGLRAVSGLIAQRNSSRVALRAGVATIGIRGTALDLACDGDCGDATVAVAPLSPLERPLAMLLDGIVRPAHAAEGQIFVYFLAGSGTLTSGGQTIPVATGATAFVPGPGLPPRPFQGGLPPVIQQLQGAPDPATEDSVDPEIRNQLDTLFDAAAAGEAPELGEGTLIVLVDEGDVSVAGVFLGEGEGVVTGGGDTPGEAVRVEVPQVQILRIPPPNVLEENAALLQGLGNSLDIEFNDNGQMCIGF